VLLELCLLLLCNTLIGQNYHAEGKYFPFLDQESQSNVVVSVEDFFGDGIPCPPQYTNTLSNTNLFTVTDHKLISEVLVKYTHVTTNLGPPGTELAHFCTTNYTVMARGRVFNGEKTVSLFRYTNAAAEEEVTIVAGGLLAEFRTKANDGYNVAIARSGAGSILRFGRIKDGLPDGYLAQFDDLMHQGETWDYTRADFSHSHLTEFTQYTNGLVFGKYLMWNPRNDNLILEADFKEPCDFQKHRTDLKMAQ
jgi:hypothetical protein